MGSDRRSVAGDVARLFFAVWPPPSIQDELGRIARDLQRQCGGRALRRRNVHLTTVFLGNIGRDRLPQLDAIAAAVAAPCFDLAIDRVEYWRHNHIVWAGVERCPAGLQALVAQLEQALAAQGFRTDARPYVPHITLVRNARRAPLAASIAVTRWPVTAHALVESVPREGGRAYEVLREWPLNA